MKSFKYLVLASFISIFSWQMYAGNVVSFNAGWRFHLGDIADAQAVGFNDSAWRQLTLPHDWSIEGDFSELNPATPGGGALPGGIGWYRKAFRLTDIENIIFYIDFDGIYRCSEVWINGHYLGKRPFGYNTVRYDLTPYVTKGNNIIAVKADNSQQPNSRWYSGSGIYRNVWLTTAAKIHVNNWGTYVSTANVSNHKAQINIQTTVRNASGRVANISVHSVIVNADNIEVAAVSSDMQAATDTVSVCQQRIELGSPQLWSLEVPYIYKLVTRIEQNGKATDTYTTPFGVRTFSFRPDSGFFLNGKNVKIKGVCNHHDLGCLGSAVNKRAIERQLELLKAMGCNGIRTSHNPPAPELLDLCDKMGFIVMDEAFDMWRKKKSPYDYATYFNDWHERDISDMVVRDRNHPCIFIWSIGNEVLEQWEHVDADTLDLKEANLLLNFKKNVDSATINNKQLNINALIAVKLADIVKKLDNTRPITSACNESGIHNNLFRSGALDIIGFNYHEQDFLTVGKNFPGKPFLVTESTSALMTRGYYKMPSDSMLNWPERWDIPFTDTSFSCSSYDNCHAPWGSTHEKTWGMVKKYPHISGTYVWTGFDYLGEPTPFWWPARSSYFGIIDLAGIPKDVYYMYQSEWTNTPVLHLFPHWNWEKGDSVDVWAYFNNADEVELFLNGKSLGTKHKTDDVFHVYWRVAYEPGTLKAVSRKGGKPVLEEVVKTAGKASKIELLADRNTILADEEDLSYISVRIVDKDGNLVPDAENTVKFSVSGNGQLAGVDNGSPISHERFKDNKRKAFYGKCLAVVQSTSKPGKILCIATAEGLESAQFEITTK